MSDFLNPANPLSPLSPVHPLSIQTSAREPQGIKIDITIDSGIWILLGIGVLLTVGWLLLNWWFDRGVRCARLKAIETEDEARAKAEAIVAKSRHSDRSPNANRANNLFMRNDGSRQVSFAQLIQEDCAYDTD